jgi:hypothetical protein
MTVRSGTAQVTVDGDIPLGVDGAAHLFVNPTTGNDDRLGFTAATALRTINEAIQRANGWLELQRDVDLVIELANGSYAETVKAFLSTIPLRRVFFRGDRLLMTVIASGVAEALSGANAIVDATPGFVADAHAGLILHVFDPLNRAATEQYRTIRSNTATTLEPIGAFAGPPVVGWTWEVLRPAVLITTNPAIQDAPGWNLVCPWVGLGTDGTFAQDGPSVHLNWIQFQKIALGGAGYPALQCKGGNVVFVGCVVQVTAPNVSGDGADFLRCAGVGGFSSFTADPVYGTSVFSDMFTNCSIGARGAGNLGSGLRWDFASWVGGFVTADGSLGPFATRQSNVNALGGSVIGPTTFEIEEGAYLFIFIGSFGTGLPFLFRGSVASGALNARRVSFCEIESGGVAFRALLGDAIAATRDAFVRILGPPSAQTVAGDIPGNCVEVATSASVEAATTVTAVNFNSTGADAAADDGTTGAWAGAAALIVEGAQSRAKVYQR